MDLVERHLTHRNAWLVVVAIAFVVGDLFGSLGIGLPLHGVSHAAGIVRQSTGQAKSGTTSNGTRVHANWSATMPARSAQEQQNESARLAARGNLKAAPVGPLYHPTAADWKNPGPAVPPPNTTAQFNDYDYLFENNVTLPSSAICPTHCATTNILEPSVGSDGKYAFITGNWFATRTTNQGATWSFLDPYTITGDGDFCCDQQVVYEPSRNLMVWMMLFGSGPGDTDNHLEIFVSAGNDLTNWCGWSIFPSNVGGTNGDLLDFPSLDYDTDNILFTYNRYNSSSSFVESVFARLGLNQLQNAPTSCPGSVGFQYVTRSDNFSFAIAQGSTSTAYWGSNWYTTGPGTGNTLRVFSWFDFSGSYSLTDVTINGWNFAGEGSLNCAGPVHVANWCGRMDSRVHNAYLSRATYKNIGPGSLGFTWTAGPSGFDSQPYAYRVYIRLSNFSVGGQDQFYNPNFAIGYPAFASPSARGFVGGMVTAGGGADDFYPTPLTIIDDVNSPTQAWKSNYLTAGSANWSGSNAWGDFNTVREWSDDLHYVSVGWSAASSTTVRIQFVIWGRARDHNSYLRWANL